MATEDYYTDLWAFDPATDSWAQKSDFIQCIHRGIGLEVDVKAFIGVGREEQSISNSLWELHLTAKLQAAASNPHFRIPIVLPHSVCPGQGMLLHTLCFAG